ncbi:MAG: sigma-70 family RNA polymerase sigma factor [Acidobacteria bacterium]|nr:sigma-70 family RNA polymerase sigma factor [Acidobacteriota bacterium]MBI3657151.1 sigma-70 family RNA polymerase sigma factor [Acidobacteriota bacterium]
MAQPETELVQDCLDGDEAAWEQIVNTYTKRIYNLVYRYTMRFDVAEDLTQEIFLRIYQSLSSYKSEAGPLINWMLTVARNICIDYFRQNRRHQKVAGTDELEVMEFKSTANRDAVTMLHLEEKAKMVRAGIEILSPELKEAIILRDMEELSYQEITHMLKIPEGTVKSRINRARIELAKILKKRKVTLD